MRAVSSINANYFTQCTKSHEIVTISCAILCILIIWSLVSSSSMWGESGLLDTSNESEDKKWKILDISKFLPELKWSHKNFEVCISKFNVELKIQCFYDVQYLETLENSEVLKDL